MSSEPLEAAAADEVSEDVADEAELDRLLLRATELVHDDPAAAEELCRRCDSAADHLGLPALSARARYLRARVLTERGELAPRTRR